MDAGNILKPRLARGDVHLIGATTLREYRTIEKDPALERRLQPVRVGEPSITDAVEILRGLRAAYEQHHAVAYTDDALRAAVELSDRYLPDRVLPDKAIDLIDQAGAGCACAWASRSTPRRSRRLATSSRPRTPPCPPSTTRGGLAPARRDRRVQSRLDDGDDRPPRRCGGGRT